MGFQKARGLWSKPGLHQYGPIGAKGPGLFQFQLFAQASSLKNPLGHGSSKKKLIS